MKHFSRPQRWALLFALVLSGCSSLGPAESEHAYLLEARFDRLPQLNIIPLTLIVSQPRATPGYDTDRMIYARQPYLLENYAKNHWAESPARMLSPTLMNVLEARTGFKAVATTSGATKGDLRLDTEIIMLRQDFTSLPSKLHMVLRIQLVEVESNRILATQTFDGLEPAPTDDPRGGVIAANRLLSKLLEQIAVFAETQGVALVQRRK